MRVTLTLATGPHRGLTFSFARHDTFLVGRSRHAHFQLPVSDKAFSRLQFMVEVNPPHCRLLDLGSRNGTFVNGARVMSADLKDGDEIRAGNTVLTVAVEPDDPQTTIAFTPEADTPFMPTIPGYIPIRELGGGSLGKVYLVTSSPRDEPCVIRIIRARQPGTRPQGDQFLEQARTLQHLKHPHIAPLIDLGAARNCFYFVFDFLAGRDAPELLNADGPLPPARALAWIDPLLDGLDHAHQHGFVLRDVRPRMVRIVEAPGRESAAWTSFGLERIYSASPLSGLAGLSNLEEQAPFLPPEFLTDYANPTPAGDVYAMAALLYHFLTGAFPFDMPARDNRRYSGLVKLQVVPLRSRRPEISRTLAEAIHKGLSRQPGQRFASIAAFRAALR